MQLEVVQLTPYPPHPISRTPPAHRIPITARQKIHACVIRGTRFSKTAIIVKMAFYIVWESTEFIQILTVKRSHVNAAMDM